MPGENVALPKTDKVVSTSEKSSMDTKREINVDDLKGRTCYFSLAGDLAFTAFENIKFSTFEEPTKKKKLKDAFIQRLNFAVLMFDHVVMHCSDPLRTEIVLEVLEEKVNWIKEGKILFIFPNGIKNIKNDYSKYIERKINEYKEGYYSEKEAESLKQEHMTDIYYDRVKKLLDNSELLVRKSNNEDFFFEKLVLDDLISNHQEQVIVDTDTDLSQILSLSLSLHQLMHIMKYQVAKNDTSDEYVFPQKNVKKVVKKVKAHLNQGNTIARVAIVDSLKDELNNQELTDMQENILEAISLRMDVLYCHMNSGKQMVLEFHPSYEHRSIYQLECFLSFIKMIAESDKKIKLNDDIINKILIDSKLNDLRLCYLASMADTHEHINLDSMNLVSVQKKYWMFLMIF